MRYIDFYPSRKLRYFHPLFYYNPITYFEHDNIFSLILGAIVSETRMKIFFTTQVVLVGFLYLAHGCVTMRSCVAYIHGPDTTLNFNLKVKFIGFMSCFLVRPIIFWRIDTSLPYLAHGCITIRRCVEYINNPETTLDFGLKVKFIGFLTCFRVRPITFLFWIDISLPYLDIGVSP